MKLYIDDIRVCPPGWVQARDYPAAISALTTGRVTEVSFDHDLGCCGERGKSGYDVACWIERAVADGAIPIPRMCVHSGNPPGRKRIQACIDAIQRQARDKQKGCPHLYYGQCPVYDCRAQGFNSPLNAFFPIRSEVFQKENSQLHVPNKLTAETLEASERGEDLHECRSVDELMEELARGRPSYRHAITLRFVTSLKRAREIVASWPKWKRNTLG